MIKIGIDPKTIEIKCKDENDEEINYSVEFGYSLKDSIIPTNVMDINFIEIDTLETHDFFKN